MSHTPVTQEEIAIALADFPVAEAPSRLIRFFRPQGLSVLVDGKLGVTPPNKFNDPFEFCAGVPSNLPTIEQMRSWLMLQNGWLRQGYERNHPHDYPRWVEEVALKEPQHWMKSLRHCAEGYAAGISCAYGVTCFMNLSDEQFTDDEVVHLWDRYSDNHKGFAVAFDPSVGLLRELRSIKWLFPVTYHAAASRMVVNPSEYTDNPAAMLRYLRRIAASKFETWKAEHEWRLIAPLVDRPNISVTRRAEGERMSYLLELWRYVPPEYQGKEIRAVYLGYRASQELKQSVITVCSQPCLSNVPVYQAAPSESSYSFSYRRLK